MSLIDKVCVENVDCMRLVVKTLKCCAVCRNEPIISPSRRLASYWTVWTGANAIKHCGEGYYDLGIITQSGSYDSAYD